MMEYLDLIIFLLLLSAGYIFGQIAEKKHFKSIIHREEELRSLLIFNERFPPPGMGVPDTQLVGGNVVISIDYFKHITASLRKLLGGRLSAYESLIERARREAILRMKEEANELGAKMVINVKLETSSISKGAKGQIGSVEVYAYGTALIPG
jgi:uncharacterized protein YbjQ (UPF0145 family)